MNKDTQRALDRLLDVAYRDSGQSEKVASFLLAWWNAQTCGGFDLTDLWGLDADLCTDALRVFLQIATVNAYPDTLGYGPQFERLVALWRPHLIQKAVE